MPSCMRPGTIDIGVVVANARYDMVAEPNANAIGMPMTMQNTSIADEEDDEIEVAELLQRRRQQPQRPPHDRDEHR